MPVNNLIQHRRGTAAAWTTANPILSAGEPGFETDTGKEKVGDGTTAWTSLLYTTDVSRLPGAVVTGTSTAAKQRPVASGSGAAVTFEPITEIDARMDYGVMCDGITDDTTVMQNAITASSGARCRLRLPSTNPSGASAPIKISGSSGLVIPSNYGFQMCGAGNQATTLLQSTDNAPILNLGGSGSSVFHSFHMEDVKFDYVNSQPSTNTNAIPLLFSAMMYQSSMKRVWFERGSYAIKLASGVTGPWGCTWDDLIFNSGLTGGAMDWSIAASAGVPNNHWGRFEVRADNMVGPIFKGLIGGAGWIWDTCELLDCNQGPQLLTMAQGNDVFIGSFSVEIGLWGSGAAGMTLIDCVGGRIRFGYLGFPTSATVGDQNVVNVGAGNSIYLLKNSQDLGALPGNTQIDVLDFGPTITSGTPFTFALGHSASYSNGYTEIGSARISSGQLFDNASSAAGETIKVRDWSNDHITSDLGDVNDTFALGMPNIRSFNTTFSAGRTMTLPTTGIPNGVYVEYCFAAGTLTTHNAIIVCNTITLLTIATQTTGVIVRFTYRRDAAGGPQAGWRCTKYNTGVPV